MDEGMRKFLNERYPGLVEQIEDPDKRLRFEALAYVRDMQSTGDLPRQFWPSEIPELAKKVRRDATRQNARLVGKAEDALLALLVENREKAKLLASAKAQGESK